MKAYTDIEQSKILAEILPLDSADMVYVTTDYAMRVLPKEDIDAKTYLKVSPCWSLVALLDILPKSEDKAFDLSYGHYGNDTYIPKWYISYVDNSKNIPFIKMIDGDNLIDIAVQLLMYLKVNEQI